jgi:uncharacterized protein YjiS (DUF1127 family)
MSVIFRQAASIPFSFAAFVHERREMRRQRIRSEQMRQLDDRTLGDIGLTRSALI